MSEITLHSKQREFVNTEDSPVLFLGGVRSGKTYAGVVKGILYALRYPGSVGAVISPTYPMVRDVVIPEYEEILAKLGIEYSLKRGDMVLNITATDSKILFRSADKPKRLEGLTLDWVHLDEAAQMSEEVFLIAKDRVGIAPSLGQGRIFITTTPKGKNWLYESLKLNAIKRLIKVYTAENPFIDPEVVEEARRTMPEKYFRQQYLADFVSWEGLVYDEFDPSVHIWRGEPPKFRRIIIGADIGYTNPTALLWIGETGDGKYIIFREYYKRGRTYEEVAKYIKANMNGAEAVVYDPSAATFGAALRKVGVPVRMPAFRDVMFGIQRVKALFEAKQLYIMPECENTIRELGVYAWKEGKDEPVKQDDHAMDAMRYGLSVLITGTATTKATVRGIARRNTTQ